MHKKLLINLPNINCKEWSKTLLQWSELIKSRSDNNFVALVQTQPSPARSEEFSCFSTKFVFECVKRSKSGINLFFHFTNWCSTTL